MIVLSLDVIMWKISRLLLVVSFVAGLLFNQQGHDRRILAIAYLWFQVRLDQMWDVHSGLVFELFTPNIRIVMITNSQSLDE